jgi:phage host-nuclease inhibitor protein Gam
MNEPESKTMQALSAWTVQTADLTRRVAAAIGSESGSPEVDEVVKEIGELKRSLAELRDEVAQLRAAQTPHVATRLSPYSPAESLLRIA